MLTQFLKDILFPIYCVVCEREGEWCCLNCLQKIELRATQECPVCYQENDGTTCPGCRKSSELDGIIALYPYQENSALGELIKQLKYQHARETVALFRRLSIRAHSIFSPLFDFNEQVTIMPIPLHGRRRRERGFNQAEFLAKIFLKSYKESKNNLTNLVVDTTSLIRSRYTEQQARLSHDKRAINLQKAFQWQGKIVPERIVLVDDVFTTGSTLQAAAKALKQAGVQSIWGLTLARGKMS
jgi:ComF family protein